MNLDEAAEEVLESLWVAVEEEGRDGLRVSEVAGGEGKDGDVLRRLSDAGAIRVEGDIVIPTEAGSVEARSVVRRHRLAERLLVDVLGTREGIMHEKACRFEHLLDRGLDENICILLGHPKICPHGKPIPPGACCVRRDSSPERIVEPLSAMDREQKGKVAYIHAPEQDKLHKLMAMGIVPGAPISLIQRSPSFVFESGQSQFAVDQEIADAIYVRLVESPVPRQRDGVDGRNVVGRRFGRRRLGRRGRSGDRRPPRA